VIVIDTYSVVVNKPVETKALKQLSELHWERKAVTRTHKFLTVKEDSHAKVNSY